MLQIDDTRRVTLGASTRQESILLFGINIINKGFLALEVEGDGIGIIGVRAHLEDRSSLHALVGGRVGSTSSFHRTLVDVHGNLVAREVHVGVFHVGVAIEMRHLVGSVIDEGVFCRIIDRSIHASRLLAV